MVSTIPILVVERNENHFHEMEEVLKRVACARSHPLSIFHARTLTEAKIKLAAHRPLVVSTNMKLPNNVGDPTQDRVGAFLLSWMCKQERFLQTKSIIYDGDSHSTLCGAMREFAIPKSRFPEVLHRPFHDSHTNWVHKVFELVMRR